MERGIADLRPVTAVAARLNDFETENRTGDLATREKEANVAQIPDQQIKAS